MTVPSSSSARDESIRSAYANLAAEVLIAALNAWRITRRRMNASGKQKAPKVLEEIEWFWTRDAEVFMDMANIDPMLYRTALAIPTPEEYRSGQYSWAATDAELAVDKEWQTSASEALQRQKEIRERKK